MINAKKAKKLRRFLRNVALDFRQREYDVALAKQVVVINDGIRRYETRIRISLNPESGRAVYRRLKPLWA